MIFRFFFVIFAHRLAMITTRRFISVAMLLLFFSCGRSSLDYPVVDDNSVRVSTQLSNSTVKVFEEDDNGYLWIGTARGLCRYSGTNFRQYFHVEDNLSSITNNNINDILCDSRGRLWVATSDGVCYTDGSGLFTAVPCEGLSQNLRSLAESPDGEIFLTSGNALLQYDEQAHTFIDRRDFTFGHWLTSVRIDSRSRFWMLCSDGTLSCNNPDGLAPNGHFDISSACTFFKILPSGMLWGEKEDGIFAWDTSTDTLIPVPALQKSGISGMSDIDEYSPGIAILCTASDGLVVYDVEKDLLYASEELPFHFREERTPAELVFVDSSKNVWLGNSYSGYSVAYNSNKMFNGNSLSARMEGNPVVSEAVRPCPDGNGDEMLLVTASSEIIMITPEGSPVELRLTGLPAPVPIRGCWFDLSSGVWLSSADALLRCSLVGDCLSVERSYPLRNVFKVFEDDRHNIWVGTLGTSLHRLPPGGTDFVDVQVYDINIFGYISDIIQLRNGKVLVAAFAKGLYTIDPDTLEVENDLDMFQFPSVKGFTPVCLHEASNGMVYVGTQREGLLRHVPGSGTFTKCNGLQCDDIQSISEDRDGNLWVGTLNGLSKYNIASYSVANLTRRDGLAGLEFSSRCNSIWNGNVVLGGKHGVTSFDPSGLKLSHPVSILIEDVYLDNKMALRRPSEQQVEIPPSTRTFSLSFAAILYSESFSPHFFYRLSGYDEEWIDSHDNYYATYSHVFPGKYNFQVRLINDFSNEVEKEVSIMVRVLPTLWQSPMMRYVGYPAAILLALYLGLSLIFKARRSRQEAEIAKSNSDFLVNISHEFRTPLMLISAPTSILMERMADDEMSHKYLNIIAKNVGKMLRLIDQFIDLGKAEAGALKLSVSEGDLAALLRDQKEAFSFYAEKRNIVLSVQGIDQPFPAFFDRDKVDKICTNLLSNAIKFTPQDGLGRIDLILDRLRGEEVAGIFRTSQAELARNYACIIVKDNGIGIPENKRDVIFEKFRQLDPKETSDGQGTGVGLYYVKIMVQKHHGFIKVATPSSDKGSEFIVAIPVEADAYSQEEMSIDGLNAGDGQAHMIIGDSEDFSAKTLSRKTILVVEDDYDTASFLQTILSPYYDVICRDSASPAYTEIASIDPDLILSDVMIPGMDGYKFCSLIKNNMETSHVPIILISGRDSLEAQIHGLNLGADAYLTKPFAPSYLLTLIRSTLENREKISMALRKVTDISKISESDALSPQDRSFMQKLFGIMEQGLDASELNVNAVAEMMHVSRSKFYAKFKSLVNESPNAYFKRYKLNRAAELILEGEFNISEIADRTGFSNVSFFSKSFKAQFGVPPSEYHGTPPVN